VKGKDRSNKPKDKRKNKSAKGADRNRHEGKELKRPKVVRDSFTMPEDDYRKIKQLKARCLKEGVSIKKGELLRAGLHALEKMNKRQLLEILNNIERVKTGRPKQE